MDYRVVWPRSRDKFVEYLAGLVAGDGQLERKRITITDANREFLEEVSHYIQKYLGITSYIHKRSNVNAYYLRLYSTSFVRTLQQVERQLYEKPTINYIRGFFDAEGGVYVESYGQKKYIVIEITSGDPIVLANIQSALYDRCIYAYTRRVEYVDRRPGRGRRYMIYRLRVKRRSSVARFLVKVGLRHPKHMKSILNFFQGPAPLPVSPQG